MRARVRVCLFVCGFICLCVFRFALACSFVVVRARMCVCVCVCVIMCVDCASNTERLGSLNTRVHNFVLHTIQSSVMQSSLQVPTRFKI